MKIILMHYIGEGEVGIDYIVGLQSTATTDENNLYTEIQATHNMYSNFYYNKNDEISNENGPLLNLGIFVDSMFLLTSSNYESLVSNEKGLPRGIVTNEDGEIVDYADDIGIMEYGDDGVNVIENYNEEEPEDALMYFEDEDYGCFPFVDSKEKEKYQSVISYVNGYLQKDNEYYQDIVNKGVTRLYYRAGIKFYLVYPIGVSENEAENLDFWTIDDSGSYNLYFESTVKYIDI